MMKTVRTSIIVAAVAVFGIFGAGAKRPVSPAPAGDAEAFVMPVPPEDYADSLHVVFYYTEGVKQSYIYENADAAMQLFTRAIESDSLFAPAWYEAANTLMESDPRRALDYSYTANELDTTEVWYKSQLGRLLIAVGRYKQAQHLYEDLIVRSPRNPENYSALAVLYEYDKQPLTAISVLDKAEAVVGKFEQLSEYKRELLVGMKMYDRAIEEGRALVASYPHNYESHLSLAELYAETGKDSLAVESYNAALALNPDGADIVMSMSEYYKHKGDNANYLAASRKLIQNPTFPVDVKARWLREITANRNFYRDNYFQIRDMAAMAYGMYPGNYEILDIYSQTLVSWGDIEGALVHHKAYLSDTITELKPFMDVIDIEAYLGRSDSVSKYTAMAIRQFPGNSELYIRQGGALRYMKQPDKALKAYRNAYKYSQTDSARSVALGIIGDHLHEQGNDKKAFDNYNQALKLWGDNVVVLNNYAYYLSEIYDKGHDGAKSKQTAERTKALERARDMSARVKELEPTNATYLDTYAWILYQLGDYEEARKVMRQAIAFDADQSNVLLMHYGDILYALGDNYMATVYWKRALEAGYDEHAVEVRLKMAE